jgi:ribose 5-phosphate isomerase B
MSRQHNDANILVLGSIADAGLAAEMLRLWCATPFEGGRHQKRIELIAAIEQQNFKPLLR